MYMYVFSKLMLDLLSEIEIDVNQISDFTVISKSLQSVDLFVLY